MSTTLHLIKFWGKEARRAKTNCKENKKWHVYLEMIFSQVIYFFNAPRRWAIREMKLELDFSQKKL